MSGARDPLVWLDRKLQHLSAGALPYWFRQVSGWMRKQQGRVSDGPSLSCVWWNDPVPEDAEWRLVRAGWARGEARRARSKTRGLHFGPQWLHFVWSGHLLPNVPVHDVWDEESPEPACTISHAISYMINVLGLTVSSPWGCQRRANGDYQQFQPTGTPRPWTGLSQARFPMAFPLCRRPLHLYEISHAISHSAISSIYRMRYRS